MPCEIETVLVIGLGYCSLVSESPIASNGLGYCFVVVKQPPGAEYSIQAYD
jgi:hypothetical protein